MWPAAAPGPGTARHEGIHRCLHHLPAALPCPAHAPQGATLLFLPLFFGVGYNRGSNLGALEAFTALLLFMGAAPAAGPPCTPAGSPCCGCAHACNAVRANGRPPLRMQALCRLRATFSTCCSDPWLPCWRAACGWPSTACLPACSSRRGAPAARLAGGWRVRVGAALQRGGWQASSACTALHQPCVFANAFAPSAASQPVCDLAALVSWGASGPALGQWCSRGGGRPGGTLLRRATPSLAAPRAARTWAVQGRLHGPLLPHNQRLAAGGV